MNIFNKRTSAATASSSCTVGGIPVLFSGGSGVTDDVRSKKPDGDVAVRVGCKSSSFVSPMPLLTREPTGNNSSSTTSSTVRPLFIAEQSLLPVLPPPPSSSLTTNTADVGPGPELESSQRQEQQQQRSPSDGGNCFDTYHGSFRMGESGFLSVGMTDPEEDYMPYYHHRTTTIRRLRTSSLYPVVPNSYSSNDHHHPMMSRPSSTNNCDPTSDPTICYPKYGSSQQPELYSQCIPGFAVDVRQSYNSNCMGRVDSIGHGLTESVRSTIPCRIRSLASFTLSTR
jgi:hypothetical protein